MSEIGLGQFIKNAFNYSIGKPVNQQPTQTANENFQQMQQSALKMVNATMQNIQRNFIQQADIMNTQMQLKQLSDLERSLMLKDLFNFPKDMKDLMEALVKTQTTQVLTSKELNSLLSQTIDISKLMQLLQTNGKQATEKLAKMIATLNQSGIYNTQQLKEMTALINACIPTADTPPALMLKTLMIMYLPWLPLAEQTGFNIGFEESKDENKGEGENVVTISIETKSFDLVRITILKDKTDMNIEVNCNESFPKKEFNDALKSEAKGYNLDSGISFTTRKSNPDSEKEASKETKINFTKSAKISPHLLLIIHTVINLVLELDKRAQLIENRGSM